MRHYDRLSALISRFQLTVTPKAGPGANLLVLEDAGTGAPSRLVLAPRGASPLAGGPGERPMLCALAQWGGNANPLFAALPNLVELDLSGDRETGALIDLFRAEAEAARCGSGSVLDRLGEVLMIRLLRAQIERGTAEPGLLAGLADPRLSRVIVALHDDPGRDWRNADLAEIAGLSLSRFAELFAATVGTTPMAYLRRWRMVLARQDLDRGERVQTVARRYGYGSGEALNRAFRKAHGDSPLGLRRRAASSS